VDTVVGVYTGTQVDALTAVASANDIGPRKQAYLTFHAQAGTAYKIAVASVNTNNLGTLKLRIAPGGLPDTNAPVVSVVSPKADLLRRPIALSWPERLWIQILIRRALTRYQSVSVRVQIRQ